MRKALIVLGALLIFVIVSMSSGQDTSPTELLLSQSKAKTKIGELITNLESLGELGFKGTEIKSKGFKGAVSQPPSFATAHLTKYQIKGDNLEVQYGAGTYTAVTSDTSASGPFSGLKSVDLSLPTAARTELLAGTTTTAIDMGTLYDLQTPGIQPIIKDVTDTEWMEHFLYSSTGLALESLIDADSTMAGLDVRSDKTKFVELIKYLLGDSTGTGAGTLTWNGFQDDRYLSFTQINNSAITGLKNGGALVNPNLTTLYYVSHVNTNILGKLIDKAEFGITTAAQASKLASHLRQVIGGKYVIIPSSTANTLYVDEIPTFKLN